MLLSIRWLIAWLFEGIDVLNLGGSWWLWPSISKWMSYRHPRRTRSGVANCFLAYLNPFWRFRLHLVIINNFNLSYLSIAIFTSFLIIHYFLNLRNFIDDSCVGWKSWIISISSITMRVGTTATIFIAGAIHSHWTLDYSLNLFFLGLVNLFWLSDKVLEFLQKIKI